MQALPAMHNRQRAALEDAAFIESSGTVAQTDLNFMGEGQFYVVVSVDYTWLMVCHSRGTQAYVRGTQGSWLPLAAGIARRSGTGCCCQTPECECWA